MSISTLTWRQTPIDVRPNRILTHSEWITHLADHITTYSNHWEVSALDGSATKEWIEIKPKAGCPPSIANCRIFIGGEAVSTGPTSEINSPHNYTTTPNNIRFLNMAPDVAGTYPNGGAANQWKSGSPWTGLPNNRSTGYVRGWNNCTATPDTIPSHTADAIYLIESEEALAICTLNMYVQDVELLLAGAIVIAPDNALGDSVRGDQGIYGVYSNGGYGFGNTSNYAWYCPNEGVASVAYTAFPIATGDGTNQRYQPLCILLDPFVTTSTRHRVGRMWNSESSGGSHGFSSLQKSFMEFRQDGSFHMQSVELRSRVDSYRYGVLRQMFKHTGWTSHLARADAAGVVRDFVLATDITFGESDCLVFSQTANP